MILGCSEKKLDYTGNTPLTINDFNKVFKVTNLPLTISDSNLHQQTDTLIIGRKALAQFVPDSIVENILSLKDKKAFLHPMIRIEKEEAYYLLLNVTHPKKQEIAVVVFSKKNKFIDYKVITEFNDENRSSKMYGKSLNINREPSFLVEENKLGDDNALTYEKKGWAYTDSSFRLIYFDSNKKLVEIELEMLNLAKQYGIQKQEFLKQYQGVELGEEWMKKISKLSGNWATLYKNEQEKIKEAILPTTKKLLLKIIDAEKNNLPLILSRDLLFLLLP